MFSLFPPLQSYINCALGIHKIGSVMICFGAMTALSAFFISAISRHIKRFAIMTSGTLFNIGLLIVLLWWKPRHDDLPMFYVIASCLGLCDAIWQTQTNSKYTSSRQTLQASGLLLLLQWTVKGIFCKIQIGFSCILKCTGTINTNSFPWHCGEFIFPAVTWVGTCVWSHWKSYCCFSLIILHWEADPVLLYVWAVNREIILSY